MSATIKIICPDCKKELLSEHPIASMAQGRRMEFLLIEKHKNSGKCIDKKVE